jgi:quinol monooxygenase YgiN
MIVLTCRAVPLPGRYEECRDAARELVESSRGHEGLLGYIWNDDTSAEELVLVEVHEDNASVLNHIALTDFTPMGSLCSLTDIRFHGDPPTAEVREVLSHFGSCAIYPSVTST